MVDAPRRWLDTMFPDKVPVFVLRYPNGEVQGVYVFERGKLNGPAAGLHESGGLCVLANYRESDRDGPLRSWDEQKQRHVYAQYTKGRKNGLVCLFRHDLPWLAQEWKANQLVAEYLVKPAVQGLNPVLAGTLDAEDAKELARAHAQLAETEAEMKKGEVELKKALREEEKDVRRQRAAITGVRKRQSMLGRANAKGAARGASIGNMWKSALRGSGL